MSANSVSSAEADSGRKVKRLIGATEVAPLLMSSENWVFSSSAGRDVSFHERENPLRLETSLGPPSIAPAGRRKCCCPACAFAVSSCSRMRRPTGIGVRREVSSSHLRSSSVTRIVSLLLIRQKCHTHRPLGEITRPPCRLRTSDTRSPAHSAEQDGRATRRVFPARGRLALHRLQFSRPAQLRNLDTDRPVVPVRK